MWYPDHNSDSLWYGYHKRDSGVVPVPQENSLVIPHVPHQSAKRAHGPHQKSILSDVVRVVFRAVTRTTRETGRTTREDAGITPANVPQESFEPYHTSVTRAVADVVRVPQDSFPRWFVFAVLEKKKLPRIFFGQFPTEMFFVAPGFFAVCGGSSASPRWTKSISPVRLVTHR